MSSKKSFNCPVKNITIDKNKLAEYKKKFDAIVNKHKNYFAKKAKRKALYIENSKSTSFNLLDTKKIIFNVIISSFSTFHERIKNIFKKK